MMALGPLSVSRVFTKVWAPLLSLLWTRYPNRMPFTSEGLQDSSPLCLKKCPQDHSDALSLRLDYQFIRKICSLPFPEILESGPGCIPCKSLSTRKESSFYELKLENWDPRDLPHWDSLRILCLMVASIEVVLFTQQNIFFGPVKKRGPSLALPMLLSSVAWRTFGRSLLSTLLARFLVTVITQKVRLKRLVILFAKAVVTSGAGSLTMQCGKRCV